MNAWGTDACARMYRGNAEALTAGASADSTLKIVALERAGFSRLPDSVLYLERDLAEPIPRPVLPPAAPRAGCAATLK